MKLSSRSRYGLRAILELAAEYGNGPLQIGTIAEREDISNKYLEQLISLLKSSGLVRSVRGPRGGYELTRPPMEVKLDEVFLTLEGPPIGVECLDHPDYCPRCMDCVTRQVWNQMQDAMLGVLRSITLQDLVDRAKKSDQANHYQI